MKKAAFLASAAVVLSGYACNTETAAPTTLPPSSALPSSTQTTVGSLRSDASTCVLADASTSVSAPPGCDDQPEDAAMPMH